MQLNQRLSLKQELSLKQVLTPKLIQMLKTFHLPYNELVETISEKTNDNVFLEVVRFDQLSDNFMASKNKQKSTSMESGTDYNVLDNTAEQVSLKDFLMKQLDLEYLHPKEKEIAEYLIQHIDNHGYITDYPNIRKAIINQFLVKERKVNDILKVIQTFEPDGVGARSLKECLLIQLDAHQFSHSGLKDVLKKVITYHLNDLSENKFDKIANKLSIEYDGVQAVSQFIKENLTPSPCAGFSNTTFNEIVIPSFEARYINNQIEYSNLEKKLGVKVDYSQKYMNMLNNPDIDDNLKAFLQNKYKQAKEFMESLENRYNTLDKLAKFVLNHQSAYLEKGVSYLEPLLQKTVAQELGISNSSVSRIVSSKFVQTPHGILSFKQLCPRNHFGKTAYRLKRIIENLINKNPLLSDEGLCKLLKKENLNMARRTVTKYRLELGIKSSFSRHID